MKIQCASPTGYSAVSADELKGNRLVLGSSGELQGTKEYQNLRETRDWLNAEMEQWKGMKLLFVCFFASPSLSNFCSELCSVSSSCSTYKILFGVSVLQAL